LVEQDVYAQNIKDYDAAFITGTSPKILPVKLIDEVRFNVLNSNVQQLIQAYNSRIEKYIQTALLHQQNGL
jgi:branched-chain amino acid aminotransferase